MGDRQVGQANMKQEIEWIRTKIWKRNSTKMPKHRVWVTDDEVVRLLQGYTMKLIVLS